jgi:hypothetical protein
MNSGLNLNQTNSKGLFITTDKLGRLTYIPDKGKVQVTVFGEFTPEHFFFYTDINGNGHKDFVYFDHHLMQAFDRFKNKLIDIELPEHPASEPLIIETENKQKYFFYRGDSGRIYSIDPKGNLKFNENLRTEARFSAWYDSKSGLIFVFVIKDQKIILYPF